ncbi:hypothetical protein NQD34_003731 [Periophthalmus magnuspinnatus]|nr:hypothetical protein NQD34_003731 [Periophthalmus magnuspinnatus]
MEPAEEELSQITSWLWEQGLRPGASADEQLCCLWRGLQRAQGNLSSLSKTLDSQRSQYAAEILEVSKSLEQIRVFTGHKDVLAQEIQDENDQLRERLQRLVSLQDLQISEVAKMLYDQGLTELIHSSPSEQVAYLLVERASLLETSQGTNTAGQNGTGGQTCTSTMGQTSHKRALRHSQSPWKKLLGLHKNQKCLLIPAESRHSAEQTNSVQKECYRLERDLEEGSRRLAMAHNEIRQLTNELECAQKIQRAYEPELQAAKHEVDQLRQEVEQIKKYEMKGLREAKETNDRLDCQIQCLRSRLRTIEAEGGLQQKGKKFQTVHAQTDPTSEPEEITVLQTEVEKLHVILQEQQTKAEKSSELNKTLETEVNQNIEVNIKLQEKIDSQMKRLLEQESEIEALKLELENCQRENKHLEQIHLDVSANYQQPPENLKSVAQKKDDCDSVPTKDVCKLVKKEIWETLKCFDQERRNYQEMQQRLQLKLRYVKLKLKDEMKWRDEKMEELERELSLCSHALTMEKEFNMNIMMENDKLLIERRRLVQELSEELNSNKKHIHFALQTRTDLLEMENRTLQNRVVDLSNQITTMELLLRNVQSLRAAEELKNTCDLRKVLTQLPAQTPSFPSSDVTCQTCCSLEGAETWSPCSSLARSAEMGYFNLNSSHNHCHLNTTDS